MIRLGRLAAVAIVVTAAAPLAARAQPASGPPPAAAPPAAQAQLEAALQTILTLQRDGEDGYATVWDGDKYVQCGHAKGGGLRCEAAGARMQPSLAHVLGTPELDRLGKLGWRLDPHFGNYAQTFAAELPIADVAGRVLRTLAEGYDADLSHLGVETDWLSSEPCPPRNGYTQNLAGMINDAPDMAPFAVHACAFAAPPATAANDGSTAALIGLYGPRVTAEIQRLRVNLDRYVFAAFNTGIGYVQCVSVTHRAAIYCEAQSADSWPALASVLTPDRIARLHALGYADPGRAPNYSKEYPTERVTDDAIARELLTILHDVYGYTGAQPLKVATETGGAP
jgi:hypothetical protein